MQGRDWLILGVIVAVAIMVWVLAGGTLIIGSGRGGGLGSAPMGAWGAYHPGTAFPRPKGTRAEIFQHKKGRRWIRRDHWLAKIRLWCAANR